MAGCKWLVSTQPLRSLLIAGQNLVCVSRPGNREQRQNRNNGQRFHAAMVVFECGQKRQSLAHFLAKPAKQSWPDADAINSRRLFDHLVGAGSVAGTAEIAPAMNCRRLTRSPRRR